MEGDQVCHATLFEWISSPTCQQGTCIGITPAEVETRMPRFQPKQKVLVVHCHTVPPGFAGLASASSRGNDGQPPQFARIR